MASSLAEAASRADRFVCLCSKALSVIRREPNLLRVPGPCVFVGDLHGSAKDLLSIQSLGISQDYSLVFLGDYVDRGPDSLEILEAVLSLKVAFPFRVVLLRGNHEISSMNEVYGFTDELVAKLGFSAAIRVFDSCKELFPALPLAAVCCGGSVFACHGGVSPWLSLSSIESCDRFSVKDVGQDDVVDTLLWSDPREGDGPSDRGCAGVHFSESSLRSFLGSVGCACLVRGHEMADGVFFPFGGPVCVTVFSASDYCGLGNRGAVLAVDNAGNFSWESFFNGQEQETDEEDETQQEQEQDM